MNISNLLWYCKTSDNSSLSRITDSVLPILKSHFDITLISNKSTLKGIKNVVLGSDTSSITYNDFLKEQGDMNENTIRCINMKYALVQIVDLIYENDFKYLVICNGIYEIDWTVRILTSSPKFLVNKRFNKTKLIVWSPIDYIPTLPVIKNVMNADLFITMNPVTISEIKKLVNNTNIDWVGHGSDIEQIEDMSRDSVIKELNELRLKKIIICKDVIKSTDIIILNANNYGPFTSAPIDNTPGTRKRLDITVKAFLKMIEIMPNKKDIKLWINTDLKSFFDMLSYEGIYIESFINNIIMSQNTLSNRQLSLVYKASSISLQTSVSEGWSLTNMEAAVHRSLQIVPDFLACGWHFSNGKGILIPVSRKIIKNEANHDVIIGEVSIEDTVDKLIQGISLLSKQDELKVVLDLAQEYAKSYTWKSITDKLFNMIIN